MAAKMEKGIFGIKKDPKNQMLFTFVVRNGDEWPSSDSGDSDYSPADNRSQEQQQVEVALKGPSKNRKRLTKTNKVAKEKLRKKSLSKVATCGGEYSHESVKPCDEQVSIADSEATVTEDFPTLDESDDCLVSGSENGFNPWGRVVPELVLLKIFRYVVDSDGAVPFLVSASRVCKLWNKVSSNTSLWKVVDLSYGWVKAKDETLEKLCRTRLQQVVEVNLSNWKALTVKGLQVLADNCPYLSSINLSHCRVHSAGILYMVEKSAKLSSIDLSSYGTSDGVSAKTLSQVINKCSQNLRSLSLSDNSLKGFNPVLKAISTICPNLEVLDISNAVFSSDFISLDIEKLQRGCPLLKILRLTNSQFRVSYASAQEKVSSPGFPVLQELCVGTTQMSSDRNGDILHRILKRSHGLKLLDLRGWAGLNGDCLQSLPVANLERLYISGCSLAKYEGIEIIMSKWHHSLVELDLSWNIYPGMSLDMAMKKLASDPSVSRLEVLDVRGTQISAGRVKSLLEGCPRLRVLSLESCRGLPRGMKKEYASDTLAQLRHDIDSFIAQEESA